MTASRHLIGRDSLIISLAVSIKLQGEEEMKVNWKGGEGGAAGLKGGEESENKGEAGAKKSRRVTVPS